MGTGTDTTGTEGLGRAVRRVRRVMSRRPTTVGEDDTLGFARSIMLWSGIHHLPVTRNARLVGILSDRDIVTAAARHGLERTGEIRVDDAMHRHVHTVGPDATLQEAVTRMIGHSVGSLPVLDGDELVGIITLTDVLTDRSLGPVVPEFERPRRATAGTLMSGDPLTATTDDPLLDVVGRMLDAGLRHMPVVDDDGALIGIVSDRDIRAAIGNPHEALRRPPSAGLGEWKVADAMTPDPIRAEVDTPVEDLVELLADERIGAIPVVDEKERPVGIVSYVDLLGWLVKATH